MGEKKTAFVLSGGGASAAWQVGALKAFCKEGIKPDFIAANSAGSLNAVGLSYAGIDELEAVWRSIKARSDIFKKNWPILLSVALGRTSFFDSTPLRKKLETLMVGKTPRYPVCVNNVSLRNGVLNHVWSDAENFLEHVLASASIPLIAPPVMGHLVDGGLRENSPLRVALEGGAERIFLFVNSPKDRLGVKKDKDVDSVEEIAERALEILMDEAFVEDLAVSEHGASEKDCELIMVQPDKDYLGVLDFDAAKIDNAIRQGFREANLIIHDVRGKDADT